MEISSGQLSEQPKALYPLIVGSFWERFSYYGAQAILVLHIINTFSFSNSLAYSIFGVFTTFAFALPVLGGIIADKFTGPKRALLIGSIFITTGNILLAFGHLKVFYLGLVLILCGTGLYKSNVTALIGELYSKDDHRRENGFMKMYVAMNVGAMLGGLIYGFGSGLEKYGWHLGFIISAIGTLNTLLYLYSKKIFAQPPTQKSKTISYGLILVIIALVYLIFLYPISLPPLLLAISIGGLLGVIKILPAYDKNERASIISILLLLMFITCFFMATLQVSSSINLFIKTQINHSIMGWQIPPAAFTALYPMAVIILAPVIAKLWSHLSKKGREPVTLTKIALAMLMAGTGFLLLSLAAIETKANLVSYYPIIAIVAANLCFGAGEIMIFPPILSDISRIAPANLRSTLMGTSFLFVSFGGFLSGAIANYFQTYPYKDLFGFIWVFCFTCSFLILFSKKLFFRNSYTTP